MNTASTDFSRPADGRGEAHQSLSVRWTALHDAAEAAAVLAGLAPEKPSTAVRDFPRQIRETSEGKLELAERGIADLTAIMQPGLTALLAVNARGQDATAPALTLWQEFHAARDAVLKLAPESGAMGPKRSA